ncbi:MAG: DNA polymerase IV [Eubacteriales bacterium]|nr:DNA polymerase IV [Eubacteriales bacterium]
MSFLHVDLNSFYASCAVVESGGAYNFDTPLMVCGDPKRRHGIVLAATYPVKRTGVRAGMPIWEALARCPNAVLVAPDFRLYMRYSDSFMRIVRRYSPLIMRYGIDEAYLDYNGCERIFGSAKDTADRIRERVKKELGLTVSVGVGDNMLMAKMGSDYKKPDAVTEINASNWQEYIWPLPVQSLMYVGKATAGKLRSIGVHTVGELALSSAVLLKEVFGICGQTLWKNANGIDDTRILPGAEPQKGVSKSITLSHNASTLPEICSALLMQTEDVAYRLRALKMRAGVVGIHFRYPDMSGEGRQVSLATPTFVTAELYESVKTLAGVLFRGRPVRQVGVRVAKLSCEPEQMPLFPSEAHERRLRLDCATDKLRDRYGADVLKRAGTLCFEHDEIDEFSPFVRV